MSVIPILKKPQFIILPVLAIFLFSLINPASAQSNVTLYSVSPTSGDVGMPIVITGSNLLQCAPVHISTACNVQFHDTDARRTTISGSVTSNTRVDASVPGGFCPGKYTIRVGEVTNNNWSNTIPFTVIDSLTAQSNPVLNSCRYISSIAPTSGSPGMSVVLNGRNLNSSVYFYSSSGVLRATVTGTVNSTYPVDVGGGVIVQFISRVTFAVPPNLASGTYTVRVGSDPVSDISNGVDFSVFGDTAAPVISNVKIINVTSNTADVTWDTNEPADGQVEYCPNYTRCGVNSALDTNLKTSHIVRLSGLTPDKVYFIWVKSRDGLGNLNNFGYFAFKTSSSPTPTPTSSIPPPTLPPSPGPVIISNVQITNLTYYSVTVSWNTDRPATGAILACTSLFFCSSGWAVNPILSTSHSLTINRLRPGTDYYVLIISRDSATIRGLYSTPYFKTQAGLSISNLSGSPTQSSITISWNTNHLSDSRVIACKFFIWCYGAAVVYDSANVLAHSLTVSNLNPGTNYYYYVISKDQIGYRVYDSNSVNTLP